MVPECTSLPVLRAVLSPPPREAHWSGPPPGAGWREKASFVCPCAWGHMGIRVSQPLRPFTKEEMCACISKPVSLSDLGRCLPVGHLPGPPSGRVFPAAHRDASHDYVDHAGAHGYILGVSSRQAGGCVDHVCVVVDLKQKPRCVRTSPRRQPLACLS